MSRSGASSTTPNYRGDMRILNEVVGILTAIAAAVALLGIAYRCGHMREHMLSILARLDSFADDQANAIKVTPIAGPPVRRRVR